MGNHIFRFVTCVDTYDYFLLVGQMADSYFQAFEVVSAIIKFNKVKVFVLSLVKDNPGVSDIGVWNNAD